MVFGKQWESGATEAALSHDRDIYALNMQQKCAPGSVRQVFKKSRQWFYF